jgi:dihydroxyacetone kinase
MSCEDQLNTMDSGSGDADCGSTLKRGAEAVLADIKGDANISARPSVVLHLISRVAEKEMGGSSGAMYSILFEAAAVFIETASETTAEVISIFLAQKLVARPAPPSIY